MIPQIIRNNKAIDVARRYDAEISNPNREANHHQVHPAVETVKLSEHKTLRPSGPLSENSYLSSPLFEEFQHARHIAWLIFSISVHDDDWARVLC